MHGEDDTVEVLDERVGKGSTDFLELGLEDIEFFALAMELIMREGDFSTQ
jgi:hypothetical protein